MMDFIYQPPASNFPPYKPGMVFNPNADPNQNYIFWQLYCQLKLLAMNVVEWVGLPDTIDKRFLEEVLFEQGYALFFQMTVEDILDYHPEGQDGPSLPGEFITLPCTLDGTFNLYNLPVNRRGYSVEGRQFYRTNDDSVLIFSNYIRMPMSMVCYTYAQRLTNIVEKINVNLFSTSQPTILTGSKPQIMSLKNMMQKIGNNAYYMLIDKGTDIGSTLNVYKTGADYMVDKLRMEYNALWNEALGAIGYRNIPFEKSSALVKSEVNVQNEAVIAMKDTALTARQDACDQINKMWPELNVSVKYRMEQIIEDNPRMMSDYFTNGDAKEVEEEEEMEEGEEE